MKRHLGSNEVRNAHTNIACNNKYHSRARATSLKAIFIKREERISKGRDSLVNSTANQKSSLSREEEEEGKEEKGEKRAARIDNARVIHTKEKKKKERKKEKKKKKKERKKRQGKNCTSQYED
jgi:hypothetical protein